MKKVSHVTSFLLQIFDVNNASIFKASQYDHLDDKRITGCSEVFKKHFWVVYFEKKYWFTIINNSFLTGGDGVPNKKYEKVKNIRARLTGRSKWLRTYLYLCMMYAYEYYSTKFYDLSFVTITAKQLNGSS